MSFLILVPPSSWSTYSENQKWMLAKLNQRKLDFQEESRDINKIKGWDAQDEPNIYD